jgi:hypothetical protein
MAGSARGRGVRAHQRKSGDAMVERGCIPTGCGVTVGAVRQTKSRTRRRMHRLGGGLPGSEMASRGSASAWHDLQIVVVVYVTSGAGHIGMAVS